MNMRHWPSKGQPVLYTRGKWFIVRWYEPVERRCRALKTKSESWANSWYAHIKQRDQS